MKTCEKCKHGLEPEYCKKIWKVSGNSNPERDKNGFIVNCPLFEKQDKNGQLTEVPPVVPEKKRQNSDIGGKIKWLI